MKPSVVAAAAAAAFIGGYVLHKVLSKVKKHPLAAVTRDAATPAAVPRSADGHSPAELSRLLAVIEADIVPLTRKGASHSTRVVC